MRKFAYEMGRASILAQFGKQANKLKGYPEGHPDYPEGMAGTDYDEKGKKRKKKKAEHDGRNEEDANGVKSQRANMSPRAKGDSTAPKKPGGNGNSGSGGSTERTEADPNGVAEQRKHGPRATQKSS